MIISLLLVDYLKRYFIKFFGINPDDPAFACQ